MYKILLRFVLQLHSFVYKLASKLAIKAEGGLHPKHRLMNYHEFFVSHIDAQDHVLDIGCGNGALAFDLAKKARQVVGIEIQEKNQHAWKQTFAAPNLTFLIADATTYKPEQTFDVVVLSNVLEHIEHRVEFLHHIKHLAPKFLIRVPMIDRDWITLYKKELGLEYRLDQTHFIEYTFKHFEEELTQAGFVIQNSSVQFGEIWAVVKLYE